MTNKVIKAFLEWYATLGKMPAEEASGLPKIAWECSQHDFSGDENAERKALQLFKARYAEVGVQTFEELVSAYRAYKEMEALYRAFNDFRDTRNTSVLGDEDDDTYMRRQFGDK